MPFRVECCCGARMTVKDELLGVTKPCPKCKRATVMTPLTQSISPNPVRKKALRWRSKASLIIGSVAVCIVGIALWLCCWLPSQHAVTAEARPEPLEQSPEPLPRVGQVFTAPAAATDSSFSPPPTGQKDRQFTNIQENVLIGVMNAQIPDSPVPPDRFQLGTVKDVSTPDRVAIYENLDYGMYLMLTGSPDDLGTVSLLIPLDKFVGETDGDATGLGAEAFGRCVLRIGTVADPSWAPQLYTWMNENIAQALVVPDGVTLSYERLVARFSTFKMNDTKLMVIMMIGTAPESPSP